MSEDKFEQWCIVEIMGHQTYAGLVTNQELGGASFIRIDVPAFPGKPAFTKMFGAGSIYCITPVSEEVARLRAVSLSKSPMEAWDFPDNVRAALRSIEHKTAAVTDDETADWVTMDDEDDEVDDPYDEIDEEG